MKQTITREFYGKEAKILLNGFVSIKGIQELDRKMTTVEITFEVEN